MLGTVSRDDFSVRLLSRNEKLVYLISHHEPRYLLGRNDCWSKPLWPVQQSCQYAQESMERRFLLA